MISCRVVGVFVGVVGFTALAAAAWAQDYTVTTATNQLETRPAGAGALNQSNGSSSLGLQVDLGFVVPYYGYELTKVRIAPGGYLLTNPAASALPINGHTNFNAPGRDATSGAFPYTPQGVNGSAFINTDGLITPMWESNTIIYIGSPPQGNTYYWTSGVAPNRRFVVSWENFRAGPSANPLITTQVHLYERTGRIVFAYSTNTAGYDQSEYVCGIDSLIDNRFTAPLTPTRTNTGYPGSDFILDPATVMETGTLLYDQIVSDTTGIGNSVQTNVPLRRCRIELRRNADGYVYASGETANDGTFSVTGVGLPAATPGSFVVLAQNAACRVVTASSGSPTSWTIDNAFSFASNTNLGTRTLTAAADPNGDTRAALHIARTCEAARLWASARTSAPILQLETLLHPASTVASIYQPAGASPASMRIASRATANADSWDDSVITKTYARHVLASIAGSTTEAYDGRFDAASGAQNAFGEGFGWYLWSVLSASSQAIDGIDSDSASVYDFETPGVTVPAGSDVAGCVAGALFDLLDSANETGDIVDGTLTPDRVFAVADTMSVAPSIATFLQAWLDAGHDGVGITRGFVNNGVLPDDGFELNDDRDAAPSAGSVGFLPKTLVLNRFNDDWVSVTLPAAASSLNADVKYDKFTTGADLALEIRNQAGTLLVSGTYLAGLGAVHAATAPVPAGTYKIGVRHLSGGTVPNYVLQVFVPPSMDNKPVRDWTIGRPYDLPLGVADGIPPYTFATISSTSLPPGFGLNDDTLRAFGTPTTVGAFPLTLEMRDSGNPVNVVTRGATVVIHNVLKIAVPAYVGFPAGRAVDATLPTIEGTPPLTLSMSAGALPQGLVFAPNSLHVTGTAAAQPSVALELDGIDVAGSADHIATRAVVAAATDVPNAPADLAAGADACGWWFDAVQGSTVSFKAKTAKGRVKRLIAAAVLAPDRSEVLTAKVKGKLGGLSVSKLVCPESGRYYVIAASEDGEATQLLGSVSVEAPKSGKAKLVDFTQSDTTEIEVGALPGATLTLKMKGDKKQQLTPKVVSVTDPDGTPVVFGGNVVTDGVTATLTMTFAKGGTWTVVVGATSATGTPGKLSYSYKLAQPRDAAYSTD